MSRPAKAWLVLAAVAALVALRISFWGQAIHPRYLVADGTPAAGGAREWTIGRQGVRAERWSARDTDGDGTWDAFATPEGSFARPGQTSARRWLVVCLDGVPLAMMQSLWDSGHFREFYRPTATVSSLPSDSETALTAALHAERVPGYEHRYFDRAANTMRGGWWVTLSGYGIPYIRKLDYDPPGWAKALPYLMPEKTYQADVGRFRKKFLDGHSPVFLAHIASSDALLHVENAEQARPYLLEFDDALRDIYLDARGDLGVIVFSDHGNNETASHGGVPLESYLAARGWSVGGSLRDSRGVVIPSYGLVGFAAIYCLPESRERLAEDLRGLEGADVIVSRSSEGRAANIRAAGSKAIATLEWSADGRRYRYSARGGDPLHLAGNFERLRAAGKLDDDGFADDEDLWAGTFSAHYPDAAARIREWSTDEVQNQADVIVCFLPGYVHGAGVFTDLIQLAGTHGGLESGSTLGFAMATYPLPAAVRIGEVIPGALLKLAAASQSR